MSSEKAYLLPFFLAIGYTALFFAFMRAVNVWRDVFNPLCLILLLGFVRFSCSGFLLLGGAELSEGVGLFYQLMQLSDREWQWGHALALAGLLAVVWGWILVPGRCANLKRLNFYLTGGAKYGAFTGMVVGFMALSVFVISNASLEVLESGAFRETTIQVGTGKYFFLAYMMMAGSVLFSCSLIARGYKWLGLVPVAISTVASWTLGGRGRALASIAAGLLLLWYIGRENKQWSRVTFRPKYTLLVPIGLLFVLWFLYVGALYRGGLGIHAFSESLSVSGLWRYVESSIFTDLGQLHSLAGAFAIGPGVLGGQEPRGHVGVVIEPRHDDLVPRPQHSSDRPRDGEQQRGRVRAAHVAAAPGHDRDRADAQLRRRGGVRERGLDHPFHLGIGEPVARRDLDRRRLAHHPTGRPCPRCRVRERDVPAQDPRSAGR